MELEELKERLKIRIEMKRGTCEGLLYEASTATSVREGQKIRGNWNRSHGQLLAFEEILELLEDEKTP